LFRSSPVVCAGDRDQCRDHARGHSAWRSRAVCAASRFHILQSVMSRCRRLPAVERLVRPFGNSRQLHRSSSAPSRPFLPPACASVWRHIGDLPATTERWLGQTQARHPLRLTAPYLLLLRAVEPRHIESCQSQVDLRARMSFSSVSSSARLALAKPPSACLCRRGCVLFLHDVVVYADTTD